MNQDDLPRAFAQYQLNVERGNKALELARGYSEGLERPYPHADLRDLMCDLLHAARVLGLDPLDELEDARVVFGEEEELQAMIPEKTLQAMIPSRAQVRRTG
jgi:hypothetical protein